MPGTGAMVQPIEKAAHRRAPFLRSRSESARRRRRYPCRRHVERPHLERIEARRLGPKIFGRPWRMRSRGRGTCSDRPSRGKSTAQPRCGQMLERAGRCAGLRSCRCGKGTRCPRAGRASESPGVGNVDRERELPWDAVRRQHIERTDSDHLAAIGSSPAITAPQRIEEHAEAGDERKQPNNRQSRRPPAAQERSPGRGFLTLQLANQRRASWLHP
jgi:hypothetical protein